MTELTHITGGCQCGKVRYRAEMAPQMVHYCHCRMCQKAVGNVFATLAPVRKSKVTWTGELALYHSSSHATRGFCRDCGTPLTFAYNDSKWINVTLGSLDSPEKVVPEIHYGIESRIPWLHLTDDLPQERTDEASHFAEGLVSHQRRDEAF